MPARPFHEALDPGQMVGMNQRADCCPRIVAVAEDVGVGVGIEELEELSGHAGLDQEPRARKAGLAGVVVLPCCLPGGRLQIRIGEDDEGFLAP